MIDDEEAAALRKKLQELKTELKTITERMTEMLDQMGMRDKQLRGLKDELMSTASEWQIQCGLTDDEVSRVIERS